MLQFDHITVIAPSLDEGMAHIRASLGLEIAHGAHHADMGTHNRRLRLGEDAYLEVIAVDPSAPPPARPRWFGLDGAETIRSEWAEGLRLKAWVARTEDIEAALASHGRLLGAKTWLEDRFHFSVLPDGALPLGGALPSVIDRGGRPPPSRRMADQGARLREFVLEHPSPDEIIGLYKELGLSNPPKVRAGPCLRLRAVIDTPSGQKVLT